MITYTNRRYDCFRMLLSSIALLALLVGCTSQPKIYQTDVRIPANEFISVFGIDPTSDTNVLKSNPILASQLASSVTQELAKSYKIKSLPDVVKAIGSYDKNIPLGTVLHNRGYPYAVLATVHPIIRTAQSYSPHTGMYSGPSTSMKVSCTIYRTEDNAALTHVIREATNSDQNFFQRTLEEALELESIEEKYYYGALISCRDAIESIIVAQ